MHGGSEKYIQHFGWKALKGRETLKTTERIILSGLYGSKMCEHGLDLSG